MVFLHGLYYCVAAHGADSGHSVQQSLSGVTGPVGDCVFHRWGAAGLAGNRAALPESSWWTGLGLIALAGIVVNNNIID